MTAFIVKYKKDDASWITRMEAESYEVATDIIKNYINATGSKLVSIESQEYDIIDQYEAAECYDEEYCIEHGRNFLDCPDWDRVDDYMIEQGYEYDEDFEQYYKNLDKTCEER